MPSDQKTITINPSLFDDGGRKANSKVGGRPRNTTLRKERKVRPNVASANANSLRRNLLEKIKQHQKKEQIEAKKRNILAPSEPLLSKSNSNTNSHHEDTFEDEFTKSLAYLSALAKSRNEERHQKKVQQKSSKRPGAAPKLTLKNHMKTNSGVHFGISNGTQVVPEISLEMPPELDVPRMEVHVVPTTGNSSLPTVRNKSEQMGIPKQQTLQLRNPPTVLPAPTASSLTQLQSLQQTQSTSQGTPFDIPAILAKEPPYGILRGGSKPTYREYVKTRKNNDSQPARLNIENHSPPVVVSAREHALNQLKEKYKSNPNSHNGKVLSIPKQTTNKVNGSPQSDDKQNAKPRRPKTVKRTTITRRFKLGKDAKKRVISVLVKNNKTRRRIKLEVGELKKTPLKDIKKYLKKHGLLKVGSSAPPDVLRYLYEQSVLTGDVHNLAKGTLIHNFMNDKDNSW